MFFFSNLHYIFPVLLAPHARLCSFLYHIIIPKELGRVGMCIVHGCVSGTYHERYTLRRKERGIMCSCDFYSVRVREYLFFICGSVHCSVCVALIASGDCQVGYRETVMTALLLPG